MVVRENTVVLSLTRNLVTAVCLAMALAGCSSNHLQYKPGVDRTDDHDRQSIPEPKVADPVLAWQSLDRTVWQQGEELLDIDRGFRKLIGRPKEAYNINRFDGVPNSSWFTNRIGHSGFSEELARKGVGESDGPDTAGMWKVFRPKVQGATPGFWIKDSRGGSYIIKFDPESNPELATAAATMGSRYFHACGYNAPQETIVFWRPEMLEIEPGITFTDRDGNKREFVQADLDDIIRRVHKLPDGRIRSLASKVLGGKVIGPFSFTGRRSDDPNDWCEHEHRRELRALYVVASFINQYDTKDQNTLDTYIEEDGHKYVKHHLIDFGSTFGSNGDRPKDGTVGYCNTFDLRDVVVSWATLGLKKWGWEDAKPNQYASIGYFESDIFEPNKWDPIVPNPAFENMTPRDAYWGAKIVMAWRDEYIRALVETGEYSDPAAKEYLIKTLIERRDKIGRHWFEKVAPLDDVRFADNSESLIIEFADLAVKYGLAEHSISKYEFEVRYDGKTLVQEQNQGVSRFDLTGDQRGLLTGAYRSGGDDDSKRHLYEVRLRVMRGNNSWSKPMVAWLWFHPEDSRFELVGIEHLY